MVNFGLNSASVLAQVNFGGGSASILGIVLAVSGAGLYFLRSVRPELARDHDIFFAAVGLLCGFILIFQGWRLDPILQFGQLLLTGATIFFAVESIRLRSVATEQAKRNTRIVDEDRPVSSSYKYEAELDDDLEPLEQEYRPRQIRGTREVTRGRIDEYEDEVPQSYRHDEYEDETPPRSSKRGSSAGRLGQADRPPRKRSNRSVSRPQERPEEDEWSSSKRSDQDWNSNDRVNKSPRTGSNGSSRSEKRNPDVTPRPRKRRPAQDSSRQKLDEAMPTDYVDYKPVERLDDSDNSVDFDEPNL